MGQVKWAKNDPRTIHLKKVLQAKDGDRIDFGAMNGYRGKGVVHWGKSGSVKIVLEWKNPYPSDLLPITLLLGLSRPQTCRKIIEQAGALGVTELLFFHAQKSEPSYARSSLWDDEWYRLLVKGAEQAFSCYLPDCARVGSLDEALKCAKIHSTIRIALDLYEAKGSLSETIVPSNSPVLLAIGPERGWSDPERKTLRKYGFTLCHMGQRVLRVETAMVASVGYLSSGYWTGKGWTGE